MADWIHCNSCFNQPKPSDSNFMLTSCGHIFCSKCETKDNSNQCKVCKTSCAVTELNSNLTRDVRHYFEDTEELLNKVCHIIKFQKGHRLSLLKAHRKTMQKYEAAKMHIRKLEAMNFSMKRKLEHYEESRNSPSPQLGKTFHFTPNSQKISPLFNSTSSRKSNRINQQNVAFREPNLRFYQQYRNAVQRTPDESPAERTPRNFSNHLNQKIGSVESRMKSKFPSKTPPYNDFKGMKITGRRNM